MIDGLRVLALIPARGGSKGVPGKNILPIGGKPLIQWTIQAARNSRFVDRVVLSSDDERIMEVAQAGGCEVPFKREAGLATDTASSMAVVVDALQRLPGHDVLVLLQPTSPLRLADDIDAALQLMIETGAPACVSVRPAQEHPYWSFRVSTADTLEHFVPPPPDAPTRRQDLPQAWCLNGAVYVARVPWLLQQQSFLSAGTVAYRMPAERSIDIDTPADVEQVKALLQPAPVGEPALPRSTPSHSKVSP